MLESIRKDLILNDDRFDYDHSASYDLAFGMIEFEYLSQFDSVLVFLDASSVDLVQLSDYLGKYVDTGGGVVLSTFWGQVAGTVGGLINSTGYNPLRDPSANAYGSATLGDYNADDPLLQGVTALSSDTYNGDYSTELDDGATIVASWDNGNPLAAYNANHTVANITLYPNVVTFGHASGDYARLFANALAFTAEAGIAASTPATAPVPEPATWAMMLAGFAVAGFALRRRPATVRVRYT